MTSEPPQASVHKSRSAVSRIREFAEADHSSVVRVIKELVRISTRGGLDPYDAIIAHISNWLKAQDLPCRQLYETDTGPVVAIVCDVAGRYPGPRYVLDACVDTAPFGDPSAWRHAPTSAAIEDGWLYGRGAADSKAAIAIFLHIARRLRAQASQLHGTVTLLFDADEHTGNFGGAKRYFDGSHAPDDIRGVMIGYPGMNELVIGGRGFLRGEITVHGEAGHTGSRRAANNVNAIEKAAELVRVLADYRVPGPIDPVLDLPPKLTVTEIAGGESYSIIPDYCVVSVDVRLTTHFDKSAAEKLIRGAVGRVDQQWPSPSRSTMIKFHESWPAYRLSDDSPIRVALTRAARRHVQKEVIAKVAGPSNIGNYLSNLNIDATAGFGVNYCGLHGTDERIELATISAVQATYHEAILSLMGDDKS